MGNTAANVSTGKPNVSGAVWVGPLNSALPVDATTAIDETIYTCLGYVSENGLENNNEMDVSEIKAWGGVIVYRSLNGLTDTFGLALIESENINVLKNVYGDGNVSQDASGNITVNVITEDPQEKVWIFDLALRGGRAKRIIIKDAAVTARQPITYNDSDAIAYGITVSAYPDSTGKTHIEYIEGSSASV